MKKVSLLPLMNGEYFVFFGICESGEKSLHPITNSYLDAEIAGSPFLGKSDRKVVIINYAGLTLDPVWSLSPSHIFANHLHLLPSLISFWCTQTNNSLI